MRTFRVPRSAFLSLILAAACWGGGAVASKAATAEFPPLTLLPIQLGASVAFLLLLMRLRGIPLRDPTVAPILGRLGLLNPGLAYALSLVGLVQITASMSVLLWAMEPVLILVLARFMLGESLGRGLLGLSAVAVAGMLLVGYEPGTTGSWVGVGLTLAGVACCALYTIVTRRWLAGADSAAHVVASQQLHALVFAVVLAGGVWLAGGAVWADGASVLGWVSALGSGVLYYAAAYWFYLSALRRVKATVAASSFYLIPVFGIAGGALLLGERLSEGQWLGAVIVLGAVTTILRRVTHHDNGAVLGIGSV